MKKLFLSIIALTVFVIIIILFFAATSSKLEEYIGEWKRIDKADHNLVIKKEDDAILIFSGKYIAAAEYDKKKSILKAYLFTASVINYIEKTDHILINNGRNGEYKRVK